MLAGLPGNLLGVRDRVLLLIGFCGAFRRSELVALDAADVAITREGLVVTIRRSKTDQEGEGRKLGIPYASHLETCPVRSLQDWLEKSGITEGPLFRPIDRFGRMASIRLVCRGVLRSSQSRQIDGSDRQTGRGQAAVETHPGILECRGDGERVGRPERGRDSARGTTDSPNAKGNFEFERRVRFLRKSGAR